MAKKKSPQKLILETLKILAPGTPLREGIDNILRAKTGALIVLGDGDGIKKILDGGFALNVDFSPFILYELAKMDGAIILSGDTKKILYANTQLVPDTSISSQETGTRHRSAERTAIQLKLPVICISERRNMISIYQGKEKIILDDVPSGLAKANQALQTLERYRQVYDQVINNLTTLELEDFVTLSDVITAIQRGCMVLKIQEEIERFIIELGKEGRLVKMQLEELVSFVEEEFNLLLRDYFIDKKKSGEIPAKEIKNLPQNQLFNSLQIADILGYGQTPEVLNNKVTPKGYRILKKIPRLSGTLPLAIIEKLVQTFGTLQGILQAIPSELDDVEGIGEIRAQAIYQGLKKMREQAVLGR